MIRLSDLWEDIQKEINTSDLLKADVMLPSVIAALPLQRRLFALAEHFWPKPKTISMTREEFAVEAANLFEQYTDLVSPSIFVPHIRSIADFRDQEAVMATATSEEKSAVTQYICERGKLPIRVEDLHGVSLSCHHMALYERGKDSKGVAISHNTFWGLNRIEDPNEQYEASVATLPKDNEVKMNLDSKHRTPLTFRPPGVPEEKYFDANQGESGDVAEYHLIQGVIRIDQVAIRSSGEPPSIRVIYYPAFGKHKERACFLSPAFLEEFLKVPRIPNKREFERVPDDCCLMPLGSASGDAAIKFTEYLERESSQEATRSSNSKVNNSTTPVSKSLRHHDSSLRYPAGAASGMRKMNF